MTKQNRFQDIYKALGIHQDRMFEGLAAEDWTPYSEFLEEILAAASISQAELKQANKTYQEIAEYLNDVLENTHEFEFYSQGSLAHKTTVRNSSSNRFDLDVVGKLVWYSSTQNPLGLLKTVYDKLKNNPRFNEGIELKNRCVMLPLPGKCFTIDLTPGQAISATSPEPVQVTDPLSVADQKTNGGKPSNPKGFTSWLDERSELTPPMVMKAWDRFTEAAKANAKPIPEQHVALDDVLRRTIQLLKLHRDAYYRKLENKDRKRFMPISILLSTLTTRAYVDLYNQPDKTPIQLILEVIDNLHEYIDRDSGEYHVDNPTIDGENFADKWNDTETGKARATEFFRWRRQVGHDLTELLTSKDPQILREAASRAFGSRGVGFVSGLIATLGLGNSSQLGGSELLGRLNPREPSRPGVAPRDTNHA